MSDYRQMQELQEERERKALDALLSTYRKGATEEAAELAAQLGLSGQFKKETQYAVER